GARNRRMRAGGSANERQAVCPGRRIGHSNARAGSSKSRGQCRRCKNTQPNHVAISTDEPKSAFPSTHRYGQHPIGRSPALQAQLSSFSYEAIASEAPGPFLRAYSTIARNRLTAASYAFLLASPRRSAIRE